MSQFSQQDDEPYDSLPQSAQDSPTVGRHQAQYLSSSPNPALDLGKRFVDVLSPSANPFLYCTSWNAQLTYSFLPLQVPAQGRPESSADEHRRRLFYFSVFPLLVDIGHSSKWHSHQIRLREDRRSSISRWDSHTGRATLAEGASR